MTARSVSQEPKEPNVPYVPLDPEVQSSPLYERTTQKSRYRYSMGSEESKSSKPGRKINEPFFCKYHDAASFLPNKFLSSLFAKNPPRKMRICAK